MSLITDATDMAVGNLHRRLLAGLCTRLVVFRSIQEYPAVTFENFVFHDLLVLLARVGMMGY